MAINLRVPEPVQDGIKQLANLDETAVESLLSVLQEQKPVFSPPQLIQQIENTAPSLSSEEVNGIIFSLISLSSARHVYDSTVEEIATTAVDSIKSDVASEKLQGLENTLSKLLQTESILITSKALEMQNTHQRVFNRCQIVTDIRPLFLEDVSEAPSVTLIVHSLILTYIENGEKKEFFIALDNEDLAKIQAQVTRAQGKVDSLKPVLSALSPLYLEVINE